VGEVRLALILTVAISTLPAQGVPTWGGLRFRMTVAQVRSVLGTRMVKPSPGSEHQPVDQTAHDIFLGVVRETSIKGFEGDVNLGFDKDSKKLSLVTLMLLPQKNISDQEKANAYARLRMDLVEKYGPPVSVGEYITIFRSGGQSVEVFASLADDVPRLVRIVYEPTNAAKGI
jgi:hypothetical protein